MNLVPSQIYFPDNVLRNIAGFLQPIENNIQIKIEQYTGCDQGSHSSNYECNLCKSAYNEPKIYFYLLKNSDKKLFKDFIERVKKITLDPTFPLKSDLSQWDIFRPAGTPYWMMTHLFDKHNKITFKKIDVINKKLYDEKYAMSEPPCFALFSTYIREIVKNVPYNIKLRHFTPTVLSASIYYILKHESRYLKNSLAITNKIFQKYSHPL